jgi:hypothetical protein
MKIGKTHENKGILAAFEANSTPFEAVANFLYQPLKKATNESGKLKIYYEFLGL